MTLHPPRNTDLTLTRLSLPSLFRSIRAFFVLTTAIALGVYVYLATLVRPIADDYCISARLIGYDPLTASLYKYWYTSNRFSNEFVGWFSDLFGPRGVAVLSVACILFWVAGLTWLLYEAARLLRIHWNFWTGLLLAELIALVSFYTASNLFQSIYWRPGVMTYFLPLVLFTFVFVGILRGTRLAAGRVTAKRRTPALAPGASVETSGRASLVTITILFFAAFFSGGLSETAGALHISILGLALAATFIWNKGATRRAALALIISALAGALLAMVGMFITPANAIRLKDTATPSMLEAILRSLTYAGQFLAEAARLLRIPSAFTLGSGFLLAFHFSKRAEVSLHRRAWLGLFLIPLLTYLLTVAVFAPSAYGQSFPSARVRFPAQVLLTTALLLEGGLLGLLAARSSLPRWTTALATIALLVTALYPLWTIRNNYKLIPEYQSRAAQWDARDAHIRELAAAGEKDIIVWELSDVAGEKELDAHPGHWINYCAAIYYGVDTISASQEIPTP